MVALRAIRKTESAKFCVAVVLLYLLVLLPTLGLKGFDL